MLDPALARGFLIALAAAALLATALRNPRPRTLASVGALSALLYFGRAFPAFVLVSAAGYAAARGIGAIQDAAARWRWTAAAVVVLAAVFSAGRLMRLDERVLVLPGSIHVAACTLDMWLALRLVTLFWEVGSGAIAMPPLAGYAGWLAFPMTLGGPLLRYSELAPAPAPRPSLWSSAAWWRQMAEGGVKLAAGIGLAALPSMLARAQPDASLLHGLLVVLVSGPLGFYLTFAGYYQLMQALAATAGIQLPDSFNWPFGRENISAFWANWNMTATRVFRDYSFYNRWGLRRHNLYANTIILFVLVGLWHGANLYWLSFGLLHGLMFCAFLAWRRWKAARGFAGTPAPWTAADIACRIATYVAVCAAWYWPSKILQWMGVI